jgi:uncharacterized protein (TIGR03546 family)
LSSKKQKMTEQKTTLFQQLKKKGFKQFFVENVLQANDSNRVMAQSVALGIFIGMTPLYGLHTVLILFLAVVLKMNKAVSYLATHISFPLFIPFIVFACLKVGGFFIENKTPLVFDENISMEMVKNNFAQYLVGSLIMGSFLSIVLGVLTYFLLQAFRKPRNEYI